MFFKSVCRSGYLGSQSTKYFWSGAFLNDNNQIFTNASDAQRQLPFPIVDYKKDLSRNSGHMYNNVFSSRLLVVKTVVFSVFMPPPKYGINK